MILLAFAAALLAQPAPDAAGLTPYLLHFTNEVEPLRVLADPADINEISFEVQIDEPWTRTLQWQHVQRITLRADGIEREESALREAWLNAEWPKHGGVQVTNRSGRSMWVLKEEQSAAGKAQTIARAAYAPPAEAAPEAALPAESSSAGPGAMQLWMPHVAVIGSALALAAAVAYLLLRAPEPWQPLNSGNQVPRKR